MKETTFITQNKKKWEKFERISKEKQSDPDELSTLFIEITDDLSYARTYYPKRTVRVYLNSLAQKVFHDIYKKKRDPLNKLIYFWTTSLPLEMYRSRWALLTAFIVFISGMLIGIVSSIDDPDFLSVIAGQDYVEMTKENISNGEPMGVYANTSQTRMSLDIASNNIRVCLFTFVLGIIFSVGSAFFLFFNGIMVGAFQWFFKLRGLLLTSFLTIWIHGAFEIPSIILAGTAGITLGNGFMFPGTLTRIQSLTISAKRGIKILIGIFPIIIIAAFIEGFATRHTEWSNTVKLFIIIMCFSIMIIYFVVYPFIVAKKYKFDGKVVEKPIYIPKKELILYKIRNVGSVFTDTFIFYRQYFNVFGRILWIVVPLSIIYCSWQFLNFNDSYFVVDGWHNLSIILGLGENFTWISFIMLSFILSVNIASVYYAFSKVENIAGGTSSLKKYFISIIVNLWRILPIVAIILLILAYAPGYLIFLSIGMTPFLFMLPFPGAYEKKSLFSGIKRGYRVASDSWWAGLGSFCIFLIVGAIIFSLSLIPLNYLISEVVDWFLVPGNDYLTYVLIKNVINGSLYLILFNILFPLFFIASGMLYFSTVEKVEAYELFHQLKSFGKQSKVYEMDNEGDY